MSTSKWFSDFNKSLNINELEKITIEKVQKEISEIINFEYWNKKSNNSNTKLIGSFAQGTSIKASEIEFLVVLPEYMYKRYYILGKTGAKLLVEDVLVKIKKTFLNTRISKDLNKVLIEDNGIKFTILPTFLEDEKTYIYPDIIGNFPWVSQDIERSILVINKRNKEMKNNLNNFAKMIKVWNDRNNSLLSEILIDSMVYEFFENYTFGKIEGFTYYDIYHSDFFNYLLKCGPDYYWYIPGTTIPVKPRSPYLLQKILKDSRDISKKAIDLYLSEYPLLARDEWIKLYGEKFINL